MGANVLIAGYTEFQLGTGSKPKAVNIKNTLAKYEYGQAGRAGLDTDGDGYREVDCSSLIWRALKDGGYKVADSVANFTTHTLFNGNQITDYAMANFNVIGASDARRPRQDGGNLQIGDIILFKAVNGSGQHVGIFNGYDADGSIIFYGSQSSTGPAFVTVKKNGYWDDDSFQIVGALRPKDSFYDIAKDTTAPLLASANGQTDFQAGVQNDVGTWNGNLFTSLQKEFNQTIQSAKDTINGTGQLTAQAKSNFLQAVDQLAQQGTGLLQQLDHNGMDFLARMQGALDTLSQYWGQAARAQGQGFMDATIDLGHWLWDSASNLVSTADGAVVGFGQYLIDKVGTGIAGLVGNDTIAQNPTIFDLSTDPVNLKPVSSDALGTTTGGQGLLGSGAGYQYSMPSQYVNGSGLGNTSGSVMVTQGLRIGNHTLSGLDETMNALRATTYGGNQGTLEAQITYAAPIASVSSLHQELTYGSDRFMGTVHYDASGNALYVTPDSGQNVSVNLYNGTTVVLDGSQDLILGQNRILDSSGSWIAYGSSVMDRQQLGVELKIVQAQENIAYTDPLMLDQGGDGIRLSATPVSFDLNADGTAESLPWSAPTDPLLVMDVNGDGRINNGSELIDLTDSGAPLNLLSLDGNDSTYWNLELWSDRNQDGYADSNVWRKAA